MILKTQTPGLIVKVAEEEDIKPLANFMRGEDVREIWKSHMLSPEAALRVGLEDSTMAFTAHWKEWPVAMFGVVEECDQANMATVWMLGSFQLREIKLGFARTSRLMIEKFHQVYDVLYNYVDIHNTASIDWLKRCGAEFEQAAPYGPFGHPFKKFTLRRR